VGETRENADTRVIVKYTLGESHSREGHIVVGYGGATFKVVNASGGNVLGEAGWNVT